MIRKRLITAAAAAAAAPLLALALAVPASASTGPRLFASCATNDGNACAGYVMSGANFERVTETAFLRNPAQYSSITNQLSWQDSLKSVSNAASTWDAIVAISDTTTSGTAYSPQSLVYHNGSLVAVGPNAVFCPAGGTCQPASAGGGFQPGDTVRQTVTYDRPDGTVNFSASDTAGNVYRAFDPVGTGIAFGQARIEAGYGSFSPPAANTKLVQISNASVRLYNGKTHSLNAFFTTSPEQGTSTGTGAGTRQAFPTVLNGAGNSFAVNFQRAPAVHS
jgi:hypothetical protein